jgi:hypothetical protein
MISGSLPLVMMAMWIGLAADGPVGGYGAPTSPPTSWRCSSCGS